MEIIFDALIDFLHRTWKRHKNLIVLLTGLILVLGWGLAYMEWAVLFHP